MADIFELLRGQKDQNGNYQKQPVIVQGITGKFGSVHTKLMLEYGTNIAAGVTPGKGGQKFENVPVYENVKEAVDATDAKISIMFVPAKFFLGAAKEALDKVKSEHLTHQIVDVTNFEIVNKNLEEVEKKHGKIDIFVNNAGIAGMNTTVAEYPLDEWKKVMNLNLNSVFYCCKAVVPFMLKNDYGRIVNIASIAGKEGNPNASAYSTSKAGVIGLTKSLGKELALKNIAVNCVTPAAAKTRIFDQMTEEHINYMLSKIPRNRFAKVEELASLVTWLSSEENSFSTAGVFDLSGGRATY